MDVSRRVSQAVLLVVTVASLTGCGKLWNSVVNTNPANNVVSPPQVTSMYLFLCSQGGSFFSEYKVDWINSVYTQLSPPSPGGNCFGLYPMTLSSGKKLIVTYGGWGVTVYAVDAATGTLTAVTGSTLNPSSLFPTVDPAGKYIYAVDATTKNSINVFSVDQTSGAITYVRNNPFAGVTVTGFGFGLDVPYISPNGKFLYMTDPTDNYFRGMLINADLSMTSITIAYPAFCNGSSNYDHSIAISPDNNYLFFSCSNAGTSRLYSYLINQSTGVPAGPVTTINGLNSNQQVVVDQTSSYLFFPGSAGGVGVLEYAITAGVGSLTGGTTYGVAASVSGASIFVDPYNAFVGTSGASFALGSGGSLSLGPNSPYAMGFIASDATMDPTGVNIIESRTGIGTGALVLNRSTNTLSVGNGGSFISTTVISNGFASEAWINNQLFISFP